jgi:chromosome segregation ATPase
LQNIDDFRSRIALIEAELTDTLLLEYSNLADSVAQLREAYSCSSIELDALTKQSLLLTESMEAMDNQIKLQKDEVLSRKQLIASLDSELEEKKKRIANSCETLRLFHAGM